MKILVVDDSQTARQVAIKCLKELGYGDVVEAQDGGDALEKLKANPGIRLVLLDRYMPSMDGLEFMRRFKADPDNQGIHVSMVTSEDDMDEKFKAVAEYSADYYIIKPITSQALVRMFARLYPDG
jgi:two-component system chemotaxis response regulator CheY